ncbi:hypothetical protein DY000_02052268 [Brassica cretica]|uniref:F-box domain-containing protein n=1 Tax=Brassica cretica TaxID=69181 RepID=A0ABQ7ABD6_BRACR|nr:hypothetical protein DY000_02052268 [Brassica cretica]
MNSSSNSAVNRTLFYPIRIVPTYATHALTQFSYFWSFDHYCFQDFLVKIPLTDSISAIDFLDSVPFHILSLSRLSSVHQLSKHSSSYFRAISRSLDTHFGENIAPNSVDQFTSILEV